jgi:hypothetical protein
VLECQARVVAVLPGLDRLDQAAVNAAQGVRLPSCANRVPAAAADVVPEGQRSLPLLCPVRSGAG